MRPSCLEVLEPRVMLAGDVVAVVTAAGDLLITGDKSDNNIAISADLGGGIAITPGDANTTINGADVAAVLNGWTGKILLRMGDGKDTVQITGVNVAGDVRFDGGRGDNTLTLDSTIVTGQLRVKNLMGRQELSLLNASSVGSVDMVNAQKGDTTTVIENSTVVGRLKLNNKDGADSLTLTAAQIGDVKVDNHKGNSNVTIEACTINGNLWLKSTHGQDSVDILNATVIGGTMKLATGDKGADINLAALTVGALDIQTGKGSDQLTLDSVAVTGTTKIKTDKGRDTITVSNGMVAPAGFGGSVNIDAGQDDDQMDIAAAFAAAVKVSGNKGDDSLNWLATSTFVIEPQTIQVETIT